MDVPPNLTVGTLRSRLAKMLEQPAKGLRLSAKHVHLEDPSVALSDVDFHKHSVSGHTECVLHCDVQDLSRSASLEASSDDDDDLPFGQSPCVVGRNLKAFRMRVWNHHLGLPPHSNEFEDFTSDESWKRILELSGQNTARNHRAFPGLFPHNFCTFVGGGPWVPLARSALHLAAHTVICAHPPPLLLLLLLLLLAAFFSVLSDKTMHSYQNDVGTRADLHALAGVRGFLCDWPLRFLEKESLELKVTSKESIAGEVMFV